MKKQVSDERIKQILKNTRASMEVEGLIPSKENDTICERYLKGEITETEAKRLLLESVKNKRA